MESRALDTIEEQILSPEDVGRLATKLWKEVKTVNNNRDDEIKDLKKILIEIEKKMNNISKAIMEGIEMKHMYGVFNELGKQKEKVIMRLQQRQSPFEQITKQDIIKYLTSRQEYDREDCKRVIAANIKTATLSKDDYSIMLKYLFGTSDAGVGGGT